MFSGARLHSMYKIANTPVRTYPFPHLFIEDIFPPEFYREMRRLLPPNGAYKRLADTDRVKGYSPARLCLFPNDVESTSLDEEAKKFWTSFFTAFADPELARMWLSIFGGVVSARMTNAKSPGTNADGNVSLTAEIFLVRDLQSYALKPHTDTPRKVITVLYYIPADDSHALLGTSVYRPKLEGFTNTTGAYLPRDDFDLVATLPYRPNCALAFARMDTSFHGVESLAVPDFGRDLVIFDVKFTNLDSF
jgi:hypothetical protein